MRGVLYLGYVMILMTLVSCGSSGKAKGDYTRNSSRSRPAPTAHSSTYSNSPTSGHSSLRNNIATTAARLTGARYRYGGNSPGRGFDCSGFTRYVLGKHWISIPRTSTDQARIGDRKSPDQAQVGDLIFFGTGHRITHVGIVKSARRRSLEVVHSTSSRGVVIDEIYGSEYWSSRLLYAVDPYN